PKNSLTPILIDHLCSLTISFFFQAEDGIRDGHVTGVQTCALPICAIHAILVDLYQQWHELRDHPEYISEDGLHPSTLGYTRIARSEERRVGKECRSRRATDK